MGTGRSFFLVLVLVSALTLHNYVVPANAQAQPQCLTSRLFLGDTISYAQCKILSSSHGTSLAWNYIADNFTFEFAFTSTLTGSDGWVGWGFNPNTAGQMRGSSALIAFQSTNGSNVLPYKLTTIASPPTAVDFEWINPNASSVEIDSSSLQVTIFAAFKLKPGQIKLNQLWNRGDIVTGFSPQEHSHTDDANSLGELDVTTGTVTAAKLPNIDLKNHHGLINGLAWGILFPLGVMAARYMRPFEMFDPLWFFVHVICQTLGYILGCVGFGMGIRLANDSGSIKTKHRNIGVVLFIFATLQILAIVLRPKPEHKFRKYWNVYHHSIGFALLVCSIINIYEGIHILQPASGWKSAYTGILITMGVVAVILEIFTWIVWFHKRAQLREKRIAGEGNGAIRLGGFSSRVHGQWREPEA